MSQIIRTVRSRGPSLANYHEVCHESSSDHVTSEMVRLAQEQADQLVDQARTDAEKIIQSAREQADSIRAHADLDRSQSVHDLAQAARNLLERIVDQITLRQEAALTELSHHSFQIAVAIAERIVRKEIANESNLAVNLVRESLEMLSGCRRLIVRVSNADFDRLERALHSLIAEFHSDRVQIRVVADDTISEGGCQVETEHGVLDQTIETQLRRIVDELTHAH